MPIALFPYIRISPYLSLVLISGNLGHGRQLSMRWSVIVARQVP